MQNPVRGFLHGGAALLSIVGAVVLWHRGAGDAALRAAFLVFGASLVGLYTVSSLYHSVPWQTTWKDRMQRADHSMIYVLVAGTYTPFAVFVFDGWACALALAATWGIAVAGIAQKILWPNVDPAFSIAMQTVQGWLALPFFGPVARALPPEAMILLIAGGLLYTIGMILFVTHRPRLWPRVFSYHEVFHVCVVAASALHYTALLTFVTPLARS